MCETKIKGCPKCSGEMVSGSNETLGRNFACTRAEPKPENSGMIRVQSYYCRDCGYVEFYKEKAGVKP